MSGDVVVIIGVGGMGVACARRLGNGRRLLLADISENVVARTVMELDEVGFDVRGTTVDVSDAASVAALTAEAAGMGRVTTVVHTAGLSPTMATVERILAVDLVGTAHVIDAFEATAEPGLVLVVIASMSGSLMPLAPDVERTLAIAPTAELPTTAEQIGLEHPGLAYSFAKRGNQLRVKASAERWGKVGARIVSISPGVISTPMGRQELEGESGEAMRFLISRGGVDRLGTAEDIASAAAWLASSEASFVTGIDLLVDGGVVAGVTTPS